MKVKIMIGIKNQSIGLLEGIPPGVTVHRNITIEIEEPTKAIKYIIHSLGEMKSLGILANILQTTQPAIKLKILTFIYQVNV